jgi:tetratricopeptide (TPR) repeat protein
VALRLPGIRRLRLTRGVSGESESLGRARQPVEPGRVQIGVVHCEPDVADRPPLQYADAHLGLARVLAGLGRADEAIRECREVLRMDPRHDAARAELNSLLANRPNLGPASQPR